MTTDSLKRRTFFAGAAGLTAAGLAGLATPAGAQPLLPAGSALSDLPSLTELPFLEAAKLRLAEQLSNAEGAPAADLLARMAAHVTNVGTTWQPPRGALADADLIVTYAFGNRPVPPGADPARTPAGPGPVNADLARVVAGLRAAHDVPVVAQWEIAGYLQTEHNLGNVASVGQVIAADGTITYLSTADVAARAKELHPGAQRVAVVGFQDHAKRCVETTALAGFASAFVPAEATLPARYDPESAQAWTRDRESYLLHDMYAQAATLRELTIRRKYPNG